MSSHLYTNFAGNHAHTIAISGEHSHSISIDPFCGDGTSMFEIQLEVMYTLQSLRRIKGASGRIDFDSCSEYYITYMAECLNITTEQLITLSIEQIQAIALLEDL